jgi:hypothetical protein
VLSPDALPALRAMINAGISDGCHTVSRVALRCVALRCVALHCVVLCCVDATPIDRMLAKPEVPYMMPLQCWLA